MSAMAKLRSGVKLTRLDAQLDSAFVINEAQAVHLFRKRRLKMDWNIMECYKRVSVELGQFSLGEAGHAAMDIYICQRMSASYASTLCDR